MADGFFHGLEQLLGGRGLPSCCLEDLGRLNFQAALELAKSHAAGDHEDWADALNADVSTIHRAMAANQSDRRYFVTFSKVPALSVAMGTPLLLLWAMARYFHLAGANGLDLPETVNPARALSYLANVIKEAGEAVQAVSEGALDGRFDLDEVRRAEKEVLDLLMPVFALLTGLGAVRARLETELAS